MTGYDSLPHHMRDAARLYIERGIPPGGFLTAILANDFLGAVDKADHINQQHLIEWARWIYNCVPRAAHGSYEAVEAWCAHGGWHGLQLKEDAIGLAE